MTSEIFNANHYHDWVYSFFKGNIRQGTALEIGAGHGIYSRKISQMVNKCIVSDIDETAVKEIKNKIGKLENTEYVVLDANAVGLVKNSMDNIFLINVLEHIKYPQALIDQCHLALKAKGRLFVFVPAFQCLYSNMDAMAGHYLRYTKKRLRQLIMAKFYIECINYFNSVGFFGWAINKLLNNSIDSTHTNTQVKIYNKIIPFIKYFDKLLPFLGQSVYCIAQKN